MHRVRVGLMGLACVFLLVMLAAAVLRLTGAAPGTDNATMAFDNAAATPNEPLAQLGVAPGNAPPSEPAVAPPRVAPGNAAPGRPARR